MTVMNPARVARIVWCMVVLASVAACDRTDSRTDVAASALAAQELLNTDRRFSRAGATTDVTTSLTAMFTNDVVMPLAGGLFARSLDDARAALSRNPVNASGRAQWYPVRGAIAADGMHGFTAGYMTIHAGADVVHAKYISYWVKQNGEWRVAAYKRGPKIVPGDSTTLGTLIPAAIVAPASDTERSAHLASLIAAEKQFSDTSQRIGIRRAFTLFGTKYAINMGPPSGGFVVGSDAIGAAVGGGDTTRASPVYWSADFALVASSGDLGVTFGLIHPHPRAGQPPRPPNAFFTIWSRPNAQGPWRYVAE